MRLLGADAEGADWREVAEIVLHIDSKREPERTRRAYESHLVVMEALEQVLHDQRPIHGGGIVHHSERRRQYGSIKYTALSKPSVRRSDIPVKMLSPEIIDVLNEAEALHLRARWRNFDGHLHYLITQIQEANIPVSSSSGYGGRH
ncbi:hypothetical protein ACVJGD_008557 [Bradyrhizobium sp. USDA 10063]